MQRRFLRCSATASGRFRPTADQSLPLESVFVAPCLEIETVTFLGIAATAQTAVGSPRAADATVATGIDRIAWISRERTAAS
jgi:hypothetical protein